MYFNATIWFAGGNWTAKNDTLTFNYLNRVVTTTTPLNPWAERMNLPEAGGTEIWSYKVEDNGASLKIYKEWVGTFEEGGELLEGIYSLYGYLYKR